MNGSLKNTIHTLTVEGYTSEGLGVARLSERPVFIHGGVRGDCLSVRIVKEASRVLYGKIEQVLSPSSARIAPDCPAFGRCGGCDFRQMTYEEELWLKRKRVEDALRRVGGLDLPVREILGAKELDGYRHKAVFPIQARDGRLVSGFYRSHSHDVVESTTCPVGPPEFDRIREAVLRWMGEHGVTVYNEASGQGLVRQLLLRKSRATGRVLVCLMVTAPPPCTNELVRAVRRSSLAVSGVLYAVNRERGNGIWREAPKLLWGEPFIEETLLGLRFRLSARAFFQVNPGQAEVLFEQALNMFSLSPEDVALDLYCGVGVFALCMARRVGKVYGVELVEDAVHDARHNAVLNGLSHVEFLVGDAPTVAQAWTGKKPTIVSVDPPRKGLSDEMVDALKALSPERIVYISCDPATLARDAARLNALGFTPRTCVAVDLFPRTSHVESVMLLSMV